ncbi:hypothetical protein HDU93_007773 [Gonapodya sp. JEL0774]|nr:hypothetical protein HDU93_007773 [Gonapodya sp. JEL0774]
MAPVRSRAQPAPSRTTASTSARAAGMPRSSSTASLPTQKSSIGRALPLPGRRAPSTKSASPAVVKPPPPPAHDTPPKKRQTPTPDVTSYLEFSAGLFPAYQSPAKQNLLSNTDFAKSSQPAMTGAPHQQERRSNVPESKTLSPPKPQTATGPRSLRTPEQEMRQPSSPHVPTPKLELLPANSSSAPASSAAGYSPPASKAVLSSLAPSPRYRLPATPRTPSRLRYEIRASLSPSSSGGASPKERVSWSPIQVSAAPSPLKVSGRRISSSPLSESTTGDQKQTGEETWTWGPLAFDKENSLDGSEDERAAVKEVMAHMGEELTNNDWSDDGSPGSKKERTISFHTGSSMGESEADKWWTDDGVVDSNELNPVWGKLNDDEDGTIRVHLDSFDRFGDEILHAVKSQGVVPNCEQEERRNVCSPGGDADEMAHGTESSVNEPENHSSVRLVGMDTQERLDIGAVEELNMSDLHILEEDTSFADFVAATSPNGLVDIDAQELATEGATSASARERGSLILSPRRFHMSANGNSSPRPQVPLSQLSPSRSLAAFRSSPVRSPAPWRSGLETWTPDRAPARFEGHCIVPDDDAISVDDVNDAVIPTIATRSSLPLPTANDFEETADLDFEPRAMFEGALDGSQAESSEKDVWGQGFVDFDEKDVPGGMVLEDMGFGEADKLDDARKDLSQLSSVHSDSSLLGDLATHVDQMGIGTPDGGAHVTQFTSTSLAPASDSRAIALSSGGSSTRSYGDQKSGHRNGDSKPTPLASFITPELPTLSAKKTALPTPGTFFAAKSGKLGALEDDGGLTPGSRPQFYSPAVPGVSAVSQTHAQEVSAIESPDSRPVIKLPPPVTPIMGVIARVEASAAKIAESGGGNRSPVEAGLFSPRKAVGVSHQFSLASPPSLPAGPHDIKRRVAEWTPESAPSRSRRENTGSPSETAESAKLRSESPVATVNNGDLVTGDQQMPQSRIPHMRLQSHSTEGDVVTETASFPSSIFALPENIISTSSPPGQSESSSPDGKASKPITPAASHRLSSEHVSPAERGLVTPRSDRMPQFTVATTRRVLRSTVSHTILLPAVHGSASVVGHTLTHGSEQQSSSSVSLEFPPTAIGKSSRLRCVLENPGRGNAAWKVHRCGSVRVFGTNSSEPTVPLLLDSDVFRWSEEKGVVPGYIDGGHASNNTVVVNLTFWPTFGGSYEQTFNVRCRGRVIVLEVKGDGVGKTTADGLGSVKRTSSARRRDPKNSSSIPRATPFTTPSDRVTRSTRSRLPAPSRSLLSGAQFLRRVISPPPSVSQDVEEREERTESLVRRPPPSTARKSSRRGRIPSYSRRNIVDTEKPVEPIPEEVIQEEVEDSSKVAGVATHEGDWSETVVQVVDFGTIRLGAAGKMELRACNPSDRPLLVRALRATAQHGTSTSSNLPPHATTICFALPFKALSIPANSFVPFPILYRPDRTGPAEETVVLVSATGTTVGLAGKNGEVLGNGTNVVGGGARVELILKGYCTMR